MTVIQTQRFRGEDELLVLPVSHDVRRASVKLPEISSATSKLVCMDKMISGKRPEPAPNQRILCTSLHYIASLIAIRTGFIIKIIEKENIGNSTKIKNVQGQVVNMMFRNVSPSSESEERPDELFAVISVEEETGKLWLTVYEILLNDKGALDNTKVTELLLSTNVPQGRAGITPVLAIQPSTPDCYIGVAVFDKVYFVTIESGCYKCVSNFTLPVDLPIVTLHIAVDESATLCACARDGTLVFYNPMEDKMADPDGPFKLLGDEDETGCVNWIGFPDDCEDGSCEESDSSRVWTNLVAATDTSILILSLTHWTITYRLDLVLPEDQDLSGRMIYSLDDRGRFLVISSPGSNYLYVLELTTTQGHLAPDAFSRMFCYPMKSGLFDLSISHVVEEEEHIQGRYEVNSGTCMLVLIAVNNGGMLKCNVKFETSYTTTHTIAELQSSPRQPVEPPSQPDQSSMAPAVQSLLSSSPISRSSPSHPMLLSPNSFTATPLPISKLLPSIPTSAPAAPTLVSLSHDLPKQVPRSSSYQSAPDQDDELVPTPLPTPAGRDHTDEGEVVRPTVNHEFLDLIQRVIIQDSVLVEDFDATLYGSPLFRAVTGDAQYLEKLANFYSEAMVGWPDIHPSVINQILSKHIIMANSDPAFIGAVCERLQSLGEDLCILLMNLVSSMFSTPSWRITINQFTVVRDMVYELYRHSIPTALTTRDMMLQLFEKLVKSHFDVMDEGEPELEADWDDFIRSNIGILRDFVIEKDSTNSEFLIKLRDIIEPLKDLLPKEYGSLKGPEGQNKLRMLMESSRIVPESEGATTTYQPTYNTTLMTLLSYLDNTEQVSLKEVCRLVDQVTGTADQDGMGSLAGAIVNNYYPKDWYKDVIDELCGSMPRMKEVLIESLTDKIFQWISSYQNESMNKNKKLPLQPHLTPALYKYSSGTSPLEFYIRSTQQEPLLTLINTTLAALLGEPAQGNSGPLSPGTVGVVPYVGGLVACYQGYQEWRRGEVVSVHGDEDVRVKLVDYGEVIATNRACLRALPTFHGVPGKAHQVRLQSVSCPEEHSDRVMQDFENILRDEELRVVPGEHQDGFTPVWVRLSDGKDLAEVLSLRGHVAWTEDLSDPFETNPLSAEKPFSPDPLLTIQDESLLQVHHLHLVDTVKAVQKYRGSELPPEVRDVLLLKARRVLGVEESDETPDEDVPDQKLTSPSTSNSIAPISSPDSASPPIPSSPTVETLPLSAQFATAQEPISEQINLHSRPQSTGSSVASSKPHSPKPQPPSELQNMIIPQFRSLDIREKHHQEREPEQLPPRVQVADDSGSELKSIIVKLERSIKQVEKNKEDMEKKVDKLLQEVGGSRGRGFQRGVNLQDDLAECATLMVDRAYGIFKENIENFYKEEVVKKLQHHLDEILDKQNQMNFVVTDKMKKSVQKNVTHIVKAVNDEVQSSVAERLASDETLKNMIQVTLLPSFQQQLDLVYRGFTDTLQRELQHNSLAASQARGSSEAEISAHLDRLEGMLGSYERAQNAANATICTKIESQLTRSVTELYQRHGVSPPDRHR
ncbi:uncharacterized protein LOC134814959 isoform X3 [Bolinopsis microptera]|uniref:uncharacterized protein LOC134814959 isoform X3 n=1 Tax=Bolinopsis microptera TaxID=2820187 RepID=UPI00307976C9